MGKKPVPNYVRDIRNNISGAMWDGKYFNGEET